MNPIRSAMDLQAIAPNVWVASQPLRFFGLEVGSRMTIIRLPSNHLMLISPIQLNPTLCDQILALGEVRYIIAPNLFHHLSVAAAAALFPKAKVWGVLGLPEKRPDLNIDEILLQPGSLESVVQYLPIQGFATIMPPSIQPANETVFFHCPSRTLILTDLAFHFDRDSDPIIQLLAKAVGSYQTLRPTFLEKWGTRDKQGVETSIRQILTWDFDRVIPGHGSIIHAGAKAQFQAGYEWFLNRSL